MPTTKKPTAHPNIAAAIAAAQANMSNAVKDSENGHFKKQYASLAAVRDVVLPAFAAEGIGVLQPIEGENGVCRVRTLLLWGDQVLEAGNCSIPIGNGRNAAQDVGAIATYLRRYQLAAVGGIAQEDNDGEDVSKSAPKRQSTGQRVARSIISDGHDPECPLCNGPMWNNVKKKLADPSWRGPWFGCKNRDTCKGAIWEPPEGTDRPSPVEDDISPPPEEYPPPYGDDVRGEM